MPARYAWRDNNSEGGKPRENIVDARAIVEEKRAQILPVIAILKIMGGADFHILSLLEVICEKSPWDHISFGVQIACPGQESHYVSPLGFLLLEEVELAFGSALQEILSIESGRRLWGLEELCSPVLASRVRRQPGRIDWSCIAYSFNCATIENAETLLTLIQNTETAKVRQVTVGGNIGVEVWATLAKALSPPTSLSIEWVAVTSRELMTDARKEDLKTVFKSPERAFCVGDKFYTYEFGEVGRGGVLRRSKIGMAMEKIRKISMKQKTNNTVVLLYISSCICTLSNKVKDNF